MKTARSFVLVVAVAAATAESPKAPGEVQADQRTTTPEARSPVNRQVESGSRGVAVNPNQPYRPVPVNRVQPRETIFEFYLRSLNPRHVRWGDELDRRLATLSEQSVGNPYFRISAIQTAAILVLLLVCWVWWDKMRQIKWVAAECLTDVINAKMMAEQKALEAIGQYNSHIENCNRVVEGQESGLPGSNSADRWRQELQQVKDKLTAEISKSAKLEEELRNRDRTQADLEQRLRQLERAVQERQTGANAELMARLQRAEAELSAVRTGKR